MMFGLILGVHKDNMEVDDDKVVEVLPEYLIHIALEYKGGVNQAIRQNLIFRIACGCHRGGLPLPYSNEVVHIAKVHLEDFGSSQQFQGSRDEGKRIPELDCDFVKGGDRLCRASILCPS